MPDEHLTHGGLRAVDDSVLVDELARRIDDPDSDGTELIGRLADGVGAKAAGHLVEDFAPQRELDYSGDTISLFVSSPAIARRLGSVAKEPFTVAWIEEHLKPGDVFYDIGANVGPYSLIASKATQGRAQVFAFEPSPGSFQDLTRNIELNGCTESVTPLPLGLWSETGLVPVTWQSLRAGAAQHRFGHWRGDATAGPMTVAMTLDDAVDALGLPLPTLVKIDVDGAELDVLRGARRTLESPNWQSVLIEMDRGESEQNVEVRSLLRAAGFAPGVPQHRTGLRAHRKPGRRPRYWLFTRYAEAA